ncbi:AAA family ATPase [Aquincola sp. S2]|uniref:AAA family ATPase n=1 Tax=Pseudaquabacterium terrae TaxID=2732868 RepID=A0ABX2EPN0_9BURK|nr:AAA family ATPase [Aquabacterium terrae]NRF70606.1 AAA family ATPase [Aquabacterium terrae]
MRQATVLLCDIVDSTALTNALDPEDARELLVRAQRCIEDVVQRHKGVADHAFDREEGDSQLFCFGLPHAQEDAAERAVTAALATIAEIARLRVIPDVSIRVRIGVATGVVVVGHGPGDGPDRKPVITGAAPNLAARLQAAAAPNTVVISPTTRKLVGDFFDCVDLGALTLKGFDEPVNAWRVDGLRQVASRFDAFHPSASLSPLVGREHEIAALLDGWDLVREGVGQAVAIGGESGIGKSRMLRVVLDRLQAEVATVLQLQCSPYHVNTAFHPVARSLERRFSLRSDAGPLAQLAHVESVLTQDHGRPAADAQLIAQLLVVAVVPVEKADASPSPPNPRRKQDTIAALLDLLEAFARKGRCLLLFEDAHWADPSTLELMGELVARVARMPLFLLVTHRPEFDAHQLAGEGLRRLTLSRLDRPQAAVLATRLAAGKDLPAQVLDRILERSDGIPLFIEELTKTTIESSEMGAWPRIAAADVPVPATLRDSLMARLDRLPAGKTVAQIGAVIGREFSHALLSAVAALSDDDIEHALDSLSRAGLTSVRTGIDGPTYVFKHALLQDIARDSLLRSRRRELNERVARTLEARFAHTAEAQPELLAHYYGEAGVHERAVEYWKRAGDQAAQRSANLEAINQLERALQLARQLPDGPARMQQELEVRAILARTMAAAKGYASPEVAQAFASARELFPHVADSTHKFVVLRGECQMLLVQARYDEAYERAHEIRHLAEDERNSGCLADAQLLIGVAHMYRGDLQQAREYLERSTRVYDPAQHLPHAVRQGADIGSAALAYLARALWLLGHPDLALERGLEAVELAHSSSIPLSLTQACGMLALVQQVRGDLASTKAWVDDTLQYAREQGQPYWIALADIVASWLRACEQPSAKAAAALARRIAQYRGTGARLGASWALLLLAEAYQAAGLHEPALNALAEAQQHIDDTHEGYYAAEAQRRRGELLLAQAGDAPGAEACFVRALAIAREQQARSWELRAATSLARLWSGEGRTREARELLAGVQGAFAEGQDTADLCEAAQLLSSLAGAEIQALRDGALPT